MRNLKLKKILPVAADLETLQAKGDDSDLHLVNDQPHTKTEREPSLDTVKETPGLHIMGDLYEVACSDSYMLDANVLRTHCLELVKNAGLTSVGELFHTFGEDGGVTGVVVLAESHMSVHTWPEKKYVTVDVYVCSYTQDNRRKAHGLYKALQETFQPSFEKSNAVERL